MSVKLGMGKPPASMLEQLQAAGESAREQTRLAREAIKDLKAAAAEVRTVLDEAKALVREGIERDVVAKLEEAGTEIPVLFRKLVDQAEHNVLDHLQTLVERVTGATWLADPDSGNGYYRPWRHCPECGKEGVSTRELGVPVRAGDIAICGGCGHLGVVLSDGRRRDVTPAEREMAENDDQACALIAQAKAGTLRSERGLRFSLQPKG